MVRGKETRSTSNTRSKERVNSRNKTELWGAKNSALVDLDNVNVNKPKKGTKTVKTPKTPTNSGQGTTKTMKRKSGIEEKASEPPASKKGRNICTAIFQEDGSIVELEVKGQDTEFASEAENSTEEESGSEEEGTEVAMGLEYSLPRSQQSPGNENGSANIVGPFRQHKTGGVYTSQFDKPSDVVIKTTKPKQGNAVMTECGEVDGINEDNEGSMHKFIDYMKQQGLVLVDASKLQNQHQFRKGEEAVNNIIAPTMMVINAPETNPKDKGKKPRAEDQDNQSEMTIYRNALPQVPPSKRDSSSSEEPLDTSDEIEQQLN